MDLSNLPAPVFTTVDGVTQGVAALCYIGVGAASWLRAPADIRTRVFLAFSIANLIVLGIPTLWWLRGMTDPTKLPVAALAVDTAALGSGALLLFHFSQVFPRRRPWIRTSGAQMAIGYVLVPLAIAGLVMYLPASAQALTGPYVFAGIVFGFPLLVLLGVVLPVAGVVSLFRSHQDLQTHGLERLKRPIELILVSQVAGGTLTILFTPILAVLAGSSPLRAVLTTVLSILGLLTPIAYAAAVWKYDLLAVDPER
jgi:hypothetical protein